MNLHLCYDKNLSSLILLTGSVISWSFLDLFKAVFKKVSFFNVDHFLKSLFNLLQYCLCFMFWGFGWEAWGVLTPQPEMEPRPCALECKVLTTGLPGKSWHF